MNKKVFSFLTLLIILSLIIVYTIASTYSVIINVKDEEGIKEIVNVITLRDLVVDDNGSYNRYYFDVKNELNITDEEVNLIMESDKLNENLQIILNSIVDYKLNDNINAKLNDDEIYNLIVDGTNNTESLSFELKHIIINKSRVYKKDISDFLYDIDVELIGGM